MHLDACRSHSADVVLILRFKHLDNVGRQSDIPPVFDMHTTLYTQLKKNGPYVDMRKMRRTLVFSLVMEK